MIEEQNISGAIRAKRAKNMYDPHFVRENTYTSSFLVKLLSTDHLYKL